MFQMTLIKKSHIQSPCLNCIGCSLVKEVKLVKLTIYIILPIMLLSCSISESSRWGKVSISHMTGNELLSHKLGRGRRLS